MNLIFMKAKSSGHIGEEVDHLSFSYSYPSRQIKATTRQMKALCRALQYESNEAKL